MGTNGVDVSNHNHGTTDLTKIPGLDFVIAKASEGVNFTDTTYGTWAQQAKAAGVVNFGAYHFMHCETLNARAQADNFLTSFDPKDGLSLWVDYENAGFGSSGQIDAEQLGLFIFYVKYQILRRYGAEQKVGIYTNGAGWSRIQHFVNELGYNALWYAKPTSGVETPGDSTPWAIHQYNSLDGLDRDFSVWTPDQWVNIWKWVRPVN